MGKWVVTIRVIDKLGEATLYFFKEEIIFFLWESCSSFLEKITLVSMGFDNLISFNGDNSSVLWGEIILFLLGEIIYVG